MPTWLSQPDVPGGAGQGDSVIRSSNTARDGLA